MKFINVVKFVEKVIPYDKALHFIVGDLTFVPIIFLMKLFHLNTFQITIYGLTIITGLAVAKEVYDKESHKGTPDANDIVYTLLGAISTLVAYLIGAVM